MYDCVAVRVVCVHVCMYVCKNVCMHIYIYVLTILYVPTAWVFVDLLVSQVFGESITIHVGSL